MKKKMKKIVYIYCCCCCCCSIAQLRPTLCNPMDCSMPGLPVPHHFRSLPMFMSISSVMPSSHLILWHSVLLLPSIFPSIKDFSNESAVCIRWPKSWNFGFSIYTYMLHIYRRRKWQPNPICSPGKSHGQRSLARHSPWGRKESDTNERLHLHVHCIAQRTIFISCNKS